MEPPFVHELSHRVTDRFDVYILAPHAPGSQVQEVMDGVNVQRFRYAPAGWEGLAYQGGILENLKKEAKLWVLIPLFLGAQLLVLMRLLQRLPIRVVHCHWILPQALIAVVARALTGRRVQILCTSHGSDLYGLKGRFFDWMRGWVVKRCDHLTVVSRAMRPHLLGLGVSPQKVSVIPMGVELQKRFVPAEKRSDTTLLLFVGRLIEIKGLRHLLEAMPGVLKALPDAELIIVGQGPQREEMEHLAIRLNIRERVQFLGAVPNNELPPLYQKAWILVFPSIGQEGFGLVPVEALGCECVPVVTAQRAMEDIIKSGTTGIIVPPKDSKKLTDAIIELGRRPDLRCFLARSGRQHVVAHFDWSVIAARYRSVLFDIGAI